MEIYPLKSVPVFMRRIWGGQRLREVFGKDLPAGERIGESWEIADLPEGKSTIGNGPLRGQTLGDVVRRYTEEIAGTRDFPRQFPLLVKFLDAQEVLSVQVHPDPETCRRMGRGDAKTECWYIIRAEPGAVIYKGFREPVTREQFAKAIAEGTAADLLAAVPVRPGECHFVPAGTIHGLGAGLLVAEIQTPSDTTYRVFDWNRVDDTGQPRQLHIAEALESIHFDVTPEKLPVTTTGRLVDCEYFRVDKGVGWAVPTIAGSAGREEMVGRAHPTDTASSASSRPTETVGEAHPTSSTIPKAFGLEAATRPAPSACGGPKADEDSLKRGTMRVLIFLSGGGSIVSGAAEPVEFKAGDSLLIPAAFEGRIKFARDTEYLIVTV
jgi:mannose-6-phosphate isomerase